jgi:hypothetical protein
MSPEDIGRLFAEAEARFDQARASASRTDKTLQRADSIMANLGGRSAAERAAARRERERLNSGLGRTAKRVGLIILGVWLATLAIGFVRPIGIFGLIAAVLVGLFLAMAMIAGSRGGRRPQLPSPTASAAQLADRLDSYFYRARPALPGPARVEVDAMLAALPELRQMLDRAGPASDVEDEARRLLGTHLPNLIDRYLSVPPGYRTVDDGDMSVDARLIEALKAGRGAIDDLGHRLAQGQVTAFETQGRFIESRYKDEPLDQ